MKMKEAPSQSEPIMTSKCLFLIVVATITVLTSSSCEAFTITPSNCQHGHYITIRTFGSSSPVIRSPRHSHHGIFLNLNQSSPSKLLAKRKEDNEGHMQNGSKENSNNEVGQQQQNEFFSINIGEPRLLLGDLISLLLTCQLLGLVDVLDKPDFWMNGGFAQSIDLSPTSSTSSISTLGTLVKRDSVMSISWVLSSLKHDGYSLGTIADDITAIKCSFTILVDYCSLLILFALVTALGTHSSVDAVLILRQTYYTILMLCTFRLVFGRFYNTGGI